MKYPFQNPDLSLEERLDDLISRLTLDEKINMLTTYQRGVPRLGIEDWHIGGEVARGYVSRNPDVTTTVLPQPIGMAGMFDPELMEKLGEIAGTEARILNSRNPHGNLMLWGPTVDACRDPRWGRNEESYGEDPFLSGKMSAAYTRGMAGSHPKYMRTVPTLKHFYANNNEEKRASCDANIDPRTKNEYYHEFFRRPIEEGGARSMMTAYNCVSGVPAIVNPDVRNVVKNEWGLDFVVTDGGDFTQNVTAHHYSDSHAETLALALKAGTDIMTDSWETVAVAARDALSRGLITEADIDGSLRCSLKGRFKLGEFDPKDKNPFANPDPALMDCEEHRRLNHRAALEQFVLLKNDGFLPLKKGVKIALIGDLAAKYRMDWYTGYSSYAITVLDGLREKFGEKNIAFDDGYDRIVIRSKENGKYLVCADDGTLYASADSAESASVFIKADWGGEVTYTVEATGKFFTAETLKADSDTAYRWFNQEILRPKYSPEGIIYATYFKNKVLGIDENSAVTAFEIKTLKPRTLFEETVISSGCERAKALAKSADVVIVCCGNDPMIIARECYDRTTLSLAPHQSDVLLAAANANPNTLLTLISSYPYAIGREAEAVRAVLYTSHAGPELGSAYAEVVSGEYNPAGRLAQTWYRSEDELPSINDYDIISNDVTYLYYRGKPLYPFGFGLSYSKFDYSSFATSRKDGKTYVTFDVKNLSDVDGEEVAQVYFRAEGSRVKRPLKQLCGFKRVFIPAKKTERVTIEVPDSELRFYDVTRDKFCVERCDVRFMAGASCEDIRLGETLKIYGEKIPPRDLGKTVRAINYDLKKGSRMKFAKYRGEHYMLGGELEFKGSKFSGEKSLQLLYATTGRPAMLRVFCDGELISEQPLGGTASETDFTYATVKISPKRGVHTLRLALDGISLLEFKFA